MRAWAFGLAGRHHGPERSVRLVRDAQGRLITLDRSRRQALHGRSLTTGDRRQLPRPGERDSCGHSSSTGMKPTTMSCSANSTVKYEGARFRCASTR